MRAVVASLVIGLTAFTATTAKAETFPVIADATVLKECGACHIAFIPDALPSTAWKKIIGDLSNHFGEDASLDPATTKHILDYHLAHAGDVSDTRAAMKWEAADPNNLRLTTAPRFIDKHGGCLDSVWKNPKIGSKANCGACHTTMQKDGSTEADISFLTKDEQASCNEMGAAGVFFNNLFK